MDTTAEEAQVRIVLYNHYIHTELISDKLESFYPEIQEPKSKLILIVTCYLLQCIIQCRHIK